MSQLILPQDLQHLSLSELCSLHATIQSELMRTVAGTPARRNALASLENIERALSSR